MRLSGIFCLPFVALALSRPLIHTNHHGINTADYIETDQASLRTIKISTDKAFRSIPFYGEVISEGFYGTM